MAIARATLTGTVISDPEKRFTSNNIAVTNFTIEMPGTARDGAYTVRVACWRNLAESVAEQIKKGDQITVEGRLQINQYEANGGVTRKTYEVDATNVYMGALTGLAPAFEGQSSQGSRGGSQQPPMQQQQPAYQAPYQQQAPAYNAAPQPVGVGAQQMPPDEFLTEDDIPF